MITIKRILKTIILGIGKLVYDPIYLKGFYFEESNIGLKWIVQGIISQKILGNNANIPWPVSQYITINGSPANIVFNPENIDNFQGKGIYYQCEFGKIIIGKGTLIANNVGLITANHDIEDIKKHQDGKDIILGENCWIGINSVILPGVVLGENTIVGAGSVVTKSFEEGNCVIGGNPAKVIKLIGVKENNEEEIN